MAKVVGSLWVEANELHYVDQFNREWYYTGLLKQVLAGKTPGSLWMDPMTGLCFINEPGTGVYRIEQVVWGYVSISTILGSIWIHSDNTIHFTAAWDATKSANVQLHTDIATGVAHTDTHSDGGHLDTIHTDVPHGDIPASSSHNDTHSDVPHGDHTDNSHDDNHADASGINFFDHLDTMGYAYYAKPHGDVHTDEMSTPIGFHHGDYRYAYSDPNYIDMGDPNARHGDIGTHQDIPHADQHVDAHHDSPHGDGSHGDTHSDHTDNVIHSDVIHTDVPHNDQAHQDTHGDTHTDTPHQDQPILVGP